MTASLGIDAPTWSRLNPLLDAALDLPVAEREAWLAALPAEHADLRGLLRDLLASAGRIESAALLEALPVLDTTGLSDVNPGPSAGIHAAGELVGPYRLLHELGAVEHAAPAAGLGGAARDVRSRSCDTRALCHQRTDRPCPSN